MRLRFRLSACMAVAVLWVGSLPAAASDLSEMLQTVFNNVHKRPPTGTEVNYYNNLARTNGPLDSYISMIGSDDYYVSQCQQNAEVYVQRLYQAFLHRDPQPDEVRFWVNQLQSGNADRITVVRSFCQANHVRQVPSFPQPNQPSFSPPATPSAIAEQVIAKSNQLAGTVQRELGGTRLGRKVLDAAATLLTVGAQYRDVVNSQNSTSDQLRTATENLESALQAVETQFRKVPAASSECQNLLKQISQLVSAARHAGRIPSAAPIAPSPLQTLTDQLADVVQEFSQNLASVQNQSPFYANLYRDISGLSIQIQALQTMASRPQQIRDMQRVFGAIQTQAREVASQLRQADPRLQQGWWNVQHQLDDLAGAMGVGGDVYVTTDHPVIVNRPAWNEFPGQVSPGFQPSVGNQRVVSLADQLISQIDTYVSSLRPVASLNRDAAQMIAKTQDLQHSVLALRQKAAMGLFGAQLQYASRDVVKEYSEDASPAFTTMVGQNPTLNSPQWMQIGKLAYEIDKAARQ